LKKKVFEVVKGTSWSLGFMFEKVKLHIITKGSLFLRGVLLQFPIERVFNNEEFKLL